MAKYLDGFGPNIYGNTPFDWMNMLGDEDGRAIYTWILALRNKEGAAPPGMIFPHGTYRPSTAQPN